MSDRKLIQQFVDSFAKLDDMLLLESNYPELVVDQTAEDWETWNTIPVWQPASISTPLEALDSLYNAIGGGPLPCLYEALVLSFRWLEVDLKVFQLFANPPGEGLEGLINSISQSQYSTESLLFPRYIPFARAGAGLHDPVCFDISQMSDQLDCPIVRIDHEALLCDSKIIERAWPWKSFRDAVIEVIFSS